MQELTLAQMVGRSMAIREKYHQLERKHHGSPWSVEEDALAFLSDAGLVARLTMAQQGRWTKSDSDVPAELAHKLSENMWWLIVLAERMGIDMEQSMAEFLQSMEQKLNK